MNKFTTLGFAGLAAAALFAGQAFATTCPATAPAGSQPMNGSPVCISNYGSDGPGTGLVNVFGPGGSTGSIFTVGSPGIDPYTQQVQMPYWTSTGSNGSVASILLQLAGNAGQDTFGIFDPTNPSNKLAIFVNGQTGNSATLNIFTNGGYAINNGNNPTITFGATNLFGFYLTTPQGNTFYSLPSLNEIGGTTYPNGTPHMVAYAGNGSNTLLPYGNKPGGVWGSNEYIQAWEDLPFASSDLDYNDFIVMVESIYPVPEPAVLGMFGLGILLVGGFAALRRRRQG